MAKFDITEGIRKAFLAGVGAMAIGAEKAQELVDDLIEKGELTVEQGKELNAELTRNVREAAQSAPDAVLKARLKTMSAEERQEWLQRASQIAADLDADEVEVEVDAEEEAAPCAEAEEAADAEAEEA